MSNTITIELCKEDRQRLDELIAFAGLIASEQKSRGVPVGNELKAVAEEAEEPQEPPRPLNPDVIMPQHPADILPPHGEPEPAAAPEPIAEPELPKYTKDDIQAKVRKLAAPGSSKRLEVKAIVQEYAAKVSDIPEDKYTEVMMKLIALEG